MGIQNVVKYLHAEMGGADFIEVRKHQCKTKLRPVEIFFDGINFRTQIAARSFDKRQYFVKSVMGHINIHTARPIFVALVQILVVGWVDPQGGETQHEYSLSLSNRPVFF
jgi:methanogenic corrinoid protein MtbC1